MKRIALALALLLLGCARPTANVATSPEPLLGFGYGAPPEYVQWVAEVQSCVRQIAALDAAHAVETNTPRAFEIDHFIEDMSEVQFFAVPTERGDGTFTCPQGFQCWGITFTPADVIYLSAQRIMDPVTVKHEIMHIIVESAGEHDVPYHGLPWGLCEYN
jgi:hypothetical protein